MKKTLLFFISLFFLHVVSYAQIDSLRLQLAQASPKEKIRIQNEIADYYYRHDSLQKTIINASKALDKAYEYKDVAGQAEAYILLGSGHLKMANYQEAKTYFQKAVENFEELENNRKEASTHNLIGIIDNNLSKYSNALESFQRAFFLFQNLKDTIMLAYTCINLGEVHRNLGKNNKALNDYKQALNFYRFKEKNLTIFFNIQGNIHLLAGEFLQAEKSFETSLQNQRTTENVRSILNSLENLGDINLKNRDYESALSYYDKLIKISTKTANIQGVIRGQKKIADVFFQQKRYKKSLEFYQKTIEPAKNHQLELYEYQCYWGLYKIYELQDKYEEALEAHKNYSQIKSKFEHGLRMNEIVLLEARYKQDNQTNEIKVLHKNEELNKVDAKRKNTLIFSLIMGFILIVFLVILVYNRYLERKKEYAITLLQKEKISKQKLELEEKQKSLQLQYEIVASQRDRIELQKNEVQDSINYASFIQTAMLPPKKYVSQYLPQNFIFYRPRDIVSGDYYWIKFIEGKVLVAAGDSTGHGVPGAFLSMLAISFLNEIISRFPDLKAGEILDKMRRNVINALHQTDQTGSSRDGSDIALCIIDLQKMQLQFAGAHNPLYLIRNKKLIEIQGDKMPIAISYFSEKPFASHDIKIQKDDMIYLFSDGFASQFGGNFGKKFKRKQFRNLLLSISKMTVEQQKSTVATAFDNWKGNLEQVDDVLLMGIRI